MSNYVQLELANVALTNNLDVEDTYGSDVLTKAQISDLFSTETHRIVGASEGPGFDIFNNIKDLSDFFHDTNSDVYYDTKKLLDDTDGELTQEGNDVVTQITNNFDTASDLVFGLESDVLEMSTVRTEKLDELLTNIAGTGDTRQTDNTNLAIEISEMFSTIVFDRSTLSTDFYGKEDTLKTDIDSLSQNIYDVYSEHSYEALEIDQNYQDHKDKALLSETALTDELNDIKADDLSKYTEVSNNLFNEEVRNENEFDEISNRLISVEEIENAEITNLIGVINTQKAATEIRFDDLKTELDDYETKFANDVKGLSDKQGELSSDFRLSDIALNDELASESGRRGRAMDELADELSRDKYDLLLDLREKLDVEGGFVEGGVTFQTDNLYLGPFWRIVEGSSSNYLLFQYYDVSQQQWSTVFPFIA